MVECLTPRRRKEQRKPVFSLNDLNDTFEGSDYSSESERSWSSDSKSVSNASFKRDSSKLEGKRLEHNSPEDFDSKTSNDHPNQDSEETKKEGS